MLFVVNFENIICFRPTLAVSCLLSILTCNIASMALMLWRDTQGYPLLVNRRKCFSLWTCLLLFNLIIKFNVLQSKVQCVIFINMVGSFPCSRFRLSWTHMLQVCLTAQVVECSTGNSLVKSRSVLNFKNFMSSFPTT